MAKAIDLTGKVFGRLTIASRASNKGTAVCWHCVCVCGTTKVVRTGDLRKGHTNSCGCLAIEILVANKTTHGVYSDPLYGVFRNMKQRCTNPKSTGYSNYGGRGITVCKEWLNDPVKFILWAEDNGWKSGLQIDRRDNDLGYFPENCRFVTHQQNSCNTRLLRKHNTSGYRGVALRRDRGTYMVYVNYHKKRHHIGNFKDPLTAAKARDKFVAQKGFNLPLNFPNGGAQCRMIAIKCNPYDTGRKDPIINPGKGKEYEWL